MNENQQDNLYMLLDNGNVPLARGRLESPPDSSQMYMRVLDDRIDDLEGQTQLRLIPMSENGKLLSCSVVRSRNDVIILEPCPDQELDTNLRQNLRMPTDFESFIYPVSGSWRGRQKIQSKDLSCGGIAFFADGPLETREHLETVIPITSQPLVVQCEILRQVPSDSGGTLYAAKFIELCNDEEMMIREAVFNVQVSARVRLTGS